MPTTSPSPIDFLLTPKESQRLRAQLGLSSSRANSKATTQAYHIPDDEQDSHGKTPSQEWLQDDRLPKTIRSAIRAGLLAASINSAIAGAKKAWRERNFVAALKRMLSRSSFRLFVAILAFSSLYRIVLQALIDARRRLVSNIGHLAPSRLQRDDRTNPRTLRARAYTRLLRLVKADPTMPTLAALAASPALALLSSSDFPLTSTALYLSTYAFASLYNELRERGNALVSWLPNWVDSTLLYAIGNGQLLWAFLFENHAFPQNYGNIILARSGAYMPSKPSHLPTGVQWPSRQTIVDHIATLATPTATSSANPSFTSPLLSSLKPSRYPTTPYEAINPVLDYSPAHPAHTQLMCALLHPTEPSCRKTLVNHFKQEWVASARFAGLFTVAASAIFRNRRWRKDPETELFEVVVSTLKMATVMSGSIGTAWAMGCFFRAYLPNNVLPRSRFFLNGLVSGLWIYVVPPSRRRELGLYVARMSALSTWQILERKRKVKPIPFGSHALLAVALAMLAGLYEVRSDHLNKPSKMLSSKLFGDKIRNDERLEQEDKES